MEAWRRPGRPELVEQGDCDSPEALAVVTVLRQNVEGVVAQPGRWPHVRRVAAQTLALADEGGSGRGRGAPVRPRTHVGDAQRSLARDGRPGGGQTDPCDGLPVLTGIAPVAPV